MVGRTRTSAFSYPGGGSKFQSFNGSVSVDVTRGPFSPYVSSVCIDETGFGIDHSLNIEHIDVSQVVPLTGEEIIIVPGAFIQIKRYLAWPPDAQTAGGPFHAANSLPSNGAVALATIARSNPSVPVVSVPNFIFELKDLPGMLEDIGRLKLLRNLSHKEFDLEVAKRGGNAKAMANVYLSYQMGWKPLFSDLRKMIQMQDAVKNRIKDLDVLFNKNGGLHRTVGKKRAATTTSKARPGLWSEVSSTSGTKFIDTALGFLVSVRYDKVTSTEMWGSVRWTNTFVYPTRLTDQALLDRARSLVFGLQITPKEVWDAIPWTWMIDWFGSFGDFLNSTNNILSLTASRPCVMIRTLTEESWTRNDGYNFISGGSGVIRRETLQRFPTAGSSSVSFPIFTGRQFSILGSLALQRSR